MTVLEYLALEVPLGDDPSRESLAVRDVVLETYTEGGLVLASLERMESLIKLYKLALYEYMEGE